MIKEIESILEIVVSIAGSASVINLILTALKVDKVNAKAAKNIMALIRIIALDTLKWFNRGGEI